MKEAKFTAAARKELDERFRKKWRRASREKRPAQGWVREIREALGISARQLAQLAGIKRSAVAKAERAERRDAIRLDVLRKLGKAMHCDLVYALVPNRPLDRILRDRAHGLLLPEILRPVMKLGMNLSTPIISGLIDQLIKERKLMERPHALWDESKVMKSLLQHALTSLPKEKSVPHAPSASGPAAPPPAPAKPAIDPERAAIIAEIEVLIRDIEEQTGRRGKPKTTMSEEEIAKLPPGVQELARQGKVEG